MDFASLASALIAARIGQAQLAMAARLLRQPESADSSAVLKLIAAANQSANQLTAAVQPGVGQIVDRMA